MRIILPHCKASYGSSEAAFELGIPIHAASNVGLVDVRMSFEFAINPRGTPVDLPAQTFAKAFFAGRFAEDLILALVADGGHYSHNSGDLYIESGVSVVLALLR